MTMHRYACVPQAEAVAERIRSHLARFPGTVPREVVTCWDGYLAACIEWGLLNGDEHKQLVSILPDERDNPVMVVYLGVEGAQHLRERKGTADGGGESA